MLPRIHVGTSGWSYKHWKEIYYPTELKPVEYLSYYSNRFKIAEINTSFYHLPKKQTVLNWVEKAGEDFMFCPKISKYITHIKKLQDANEPLQKFFEVFDLIQPNLGPVLIQLPPSLKYQSEMAATFFNALHIYQSDYDFVLEIRHPSWLEDEPQKLLRSYSIGFVMSHSKDRFPYAELITSKHIYLRLHGPGALYASDYSDQMLQNYAQKFLHWQGAGHEVWAFFNNDIQGFAYRNAARLLEMVNEI